MNEKTELGTFLPWIAEFRGSHWEHLFQWSEWTQADRLAESEGLAAADFDPILSEASSASLYFTSLARSLCRRFDEEISRYCGFEVGLRFSEFDGPEDRILATMTVHGARKLFDFSAQRGHHALIAAIRDRFAPYDGLVPYPADAVDEWIAQPIELWGRSELSDLLGVVAHAGIDEQLYACISDGNDVRRAFEGCVDWKRYAELVIDRRRTLPMDVSATTHP
jgi:hypothetical protein